jgi:hypothetical protein
VAGEELFDLAAQVRDVPRRARGAEAGEDFGDGGSAVKSPGQFVRNRPRDSRLSGSRPATHAS